MYADICTCMFTHLQQTPITTQQLPQILFMDIATELRPRLPDLRASLGVPADAVPLPPREKRPTRAQQRELEWQQGRPRRDSGYSRDSYRSDRFSGGRGRGRGSPRGSSERSLDSPRGGRGGYSSSSSGRDYGDRRSSSSSGRDYGSSTSGTSSRDGSDSRDTNYSRRDQEE
jgi:hypothetical protein